jgi:uncharacterized protein YggL (DUF469 family)
MTDYNTQMMNSRQADEDKAEALDDAIDARVAELLMPGEECDPLDGLNICEALNESTNSEKMVLGKVLAERKFDQAGILVEWLTKSYWGKKAEELAVRELT